MAVVVVMVVVTAALEVLEEDRDRGERPNSNYNLYLH